MGVAMLCKSIQWLSWRIFRFFERQKMIIILIFVILTGLLADSPVNAQKTTLETIKKMLQSSKIEGLYLNTYYSLLDRIDVDGFLQESFTGRYPGMFPRTVGGAVALFIETGELQVAEKLIHCTLQAMTENEMERIPHVFLRKKNDLLPVYNNKELLQAASSVELYQLSQGHSSAMKFKAPEKAIIAVEAAIRVSACKGRLTLSIRKDIQSIPIKSVDIDVKQVNPGQLWQRFEFEESLKLDRGEDYYIRFDFNGFGSPVWLGLDKYQGEGTGAFWLDTSVKPQVWINEQNHAPAYAIDSGNLRHEQQVKPYEIYCDWDQIDGQAHVIMAWAQLALLRGRTDFEDVAYEIIAKLMDEYFIGAFSGRPLLACLGFVDTMCGWFFSGSDD
jgi:hypothetical protein